MIITKKHLSRRTFLRGTVGTMLALPMLDAMVPALTAQSRAAAAVPVRRHLHAERCVPRNVAPRHGGRRLRLQAVMQPLEPFRDQLVTVSKLRRRGASRSTWVPARRC